MQPYRNPSYLMPEGAVLTCQKALAEPSFMPPADIRFMVDSWAKRPRKNLYIHGKPGNGKTNLAKYAYHYLVQNRCWTRFINMQELVEYVKDKHKEGMTTPEIVERYFDCDYLIIDDLGTEERIIPYGEATFRSIVYPIINARYDVSPVYPTLITSNLKPEDLCSYYAEKDEIQALRFRSRLMNVNACDIIAMNYETHRHEGDTCKHLS